jgi:AcrR family transcriptional regulator
MKAPPRGAVRGPRSTRRRAEILRSAAAAFARRGFHGTSVEEIATTLGMTKGSLYYYFRSKQEILFFCHDYSLDLLLELLARVQSSKSPADAKLRELVEGFVRVIVDDLQGTPLTQDVQALSSELLKRVVAKRDRFDRGLREIVREGMRQGIFDEGDPDLLGFAVLGSINWITRWYSPAGPARSDEIARAYADFVLDGLRGARRARPAGRGHSKKGTSSTA